MARAHFGYLLEPATLRRRGRPLADGSYPNLISQINIVLGEQLFVHCELDGTEFLVWIESDERFMAHRAQLGSGEKIFGYYAMPQDALHAM